MPNREQEREVGRRRNGAVGTSTICVDFRKAITVAFREEESGRKCMRH